VTAPASEPPGSGDLGDRGAHVDCFVSHAGRDRAWAEWVAWEIQAAGYSVELDLWDWEAGENFVEKMRDALERADRMVALFSPAYFEPQRHTSPELTAVLADRSPSRKRLIPLRIEPVTVPGLYRPLLAIDLFGVPEEQARRQLIEAIRGRQRPDGRPEFPGTGARLQDGPGTSRPRRPGSLPGVWNVPPRNPAFTGRDRMIVDLREGLLGGNQMLVYALEGMGGVGKTQLAVEYAHRFAGDYDLVWWIAGENPALIGEQLAALAVAAGLIGIDEGITAAVAAARNHVRGIDRSLLIFDNVEKREDLHQWLTGGSVHVLVTSRSPLWSGVAASVSVDVFARAESTALLRRNAPELDDDEADRLARGLGDLPLAVAQAADLLAETGMRVTDYLDALDRRAAELLDADSPPVGYPRPLAAAVSLAAGRLATDAPAAGQLLTLCAYLAPEPIPLDLFTSSSGLDLPAELAAVTGSSVALARAAGRLTRYGLARATTGGLQLHRLTQAVIRDTDPHPDRHCRLVEQLLIAAKPDDGTDPAMWPRWSLLLPHILACNPAATDSDRLRRLAFDACWHLLARGDAHTALPLAKHLHANWATRLGPDDPTTLLATSALGYAHRQLGHYTQARQLDEDALTRHRRLLGDDHPHTLNSADAVANTLQEMGEHEQARHLREDTLTRRRRLFGDDHPDTLGSANNLANDLYLLGEYELSRHLHVDTLARRRRVLGDDHPETLKSANNLANNLQELGEIRQARELYEDTLARRRRVLGDDHPNTLNSASNLAINLQGVGEIGQARELYEDTLARRRRVLGDDHPETLASAESLRRLGERNHGE
jgi:tetratricopeptide (TPR) repeat protein